MRFRYSTASYGQDEFDSLPRVPLVLRSGDRAIETFGLVDSGATINVLPYELGLQLGETWDESKTIIPLAGSLGNRTAIPVFAQAEIKNVQTVRLAFAWIKNDDVPLILGQTNFFMEFDICFYRSRLEFEINPKSTST